MQFDPCEKYTDSALRPGDADRYPQRKVGEFIGFVASNDWVNEEYKHIVLDVHPRALDATAGQFFHLLCPTPDGAEVWMRRPMSVYRVDKPSLGRSGQARRDGPSSSSTRRKAAARAAWRCW